VPAQGPPQRVDHLFSPDVGRRDYRNHRKTPSFSYGDIRRVGNKFFYNLIGQSQSENKDGDFLDAMIEANMPLAEREKT
jgi:hypothetical protein